MKPGGDVLEERRASPEAQKLPGRGCGSHLWNRGRQVVRILLLILITYLWGVMLNRSVARTEQGSSRAGFFSGALHGAMMPGALPSLLLGKDVVIYAEKNEGRWYKLGYTAGVNACGALFFGAFYYRLNRWRKNYGNKE